VFPLLLSPFLRFQSLVRFPMFTHWVAALIKFFYFFSSFSYVLSKIIVKSLYVVNNTLQSRFAKTVSYDLTFAALENNVSLTQHLKTEKKNHYLPPKHAGQENEYREVNFNCVVLVCYAA